MVELASVILIQFSINKKRNVMRILKPGLTKKSRICMWLSGTGGAILLFMFINGYSRTHEGAWLIIVGVTACIMGYDYFTRKREDGTKVQ